jgi:hypothetical protein
MLLWLIRAAKTKEFWPIVQVFHEPYPPKKTLVISRGGKDAIRGFENEDAMLDIMDKYNASIFTASCLLMSRYSVEAQLTYRFVGPMELNKMNFTEQVIL